MHTLAPSILGWEEYSKMQQSCLKHPSPMLLEVKDSAGNSHEVSIAYGKIVEFPYSSQYKNYTVSRGSRNTKRVYIDQPTKETLKNHYTECRIKSSNAMHEALQKFDELLKDLLKDHSEVLEFANNLPNLNSVEKHNWYFSNNYSNIPSLEWFEFHNRIDRLEKVDEDGFGHYFGETILIDHKAKVFGNAFGWSSDD